MNSSLAIVWRFFSAGLVRCLKSSDEFPCREAAARQVRAQSRKGASLLMIGAEGSRDRHDERQRLPAASDRQKRIADLAHVAADELHLVLERRNAGAQFADVVIECERLRLDQRASVL